MAANGLAATPLLLAGNDEQKKRYLGQLTSECSFAAFCTTEPGAGSDVAGMSTTYRKVGDEYVINGVKHFISNGTVADWYVVFATKDKKEKHKGISGFVFPGDLPGIKKHKMKDKLGQRAADTGEVVFEDVRVPRQALLGEEGQGFKIAMQTFDRTRPEIGAICIGISQRALDECTKYALERQQFGVPIASFQALRHRMADVKMQLELGRSMSYYASLKLGEPAPQRRRAISQARVQLGQSMRFVGQQCIQLHGGIGCTDECSASHYFKRLTMLELAWGDTLHHLGEVSERMQDTAGVFA